MDLSGILKALLVLFVAGATLYLFFLGIYRNLRWRFPGLSPLWFGVAAAVFTVSASAGVVWVYRQPNVNCGMTEVGIVRSAQGNPLGTAREGGWDGGVADTERTARLCRALWRDCPTWRSDYTAKVERICTEVTAFDAER